MRMKEKVMNDFIAEIAELKQQRDELHRDAERYRWLRDGGIYALPYDDHGLGPKFDLSDAAIDAAIAKEQK